MTTIVAQRRCLAEDLYVNNLSGDDLNDGTALVLGSPSSGPVKTIRKALLLAKFGDRIIVQKTTENYHESITLQGQHHSGTDLLPFRLVSDGAILDGTRPVPIVAWEHHKRNVFRFRPKWLSHQQLYLDGRPAQRVTSNVRGSVPELAPGQWALAEGFIFFCTDGGRIPSQYNLSFSAHQTGVTLYDVRNVVIDGLIVQGFQLDGINAHDSVVRTRIENSLLRGNGRSGLSVGGASRVKLVNSVIGDNYKAQVRTEGYSKLEIENSQMLESTENGPPILRTGGRVTVDGQKFD